MMANAEPRGAARKAARPAWNAREALKPFPGWSLVDDAATTLGISRQAVHRLLERGTIRPRDARWLGHDANRQPIIVVRDKAIAALPMSPQRAREFRLRAEAAGAAEGDELPELGDPRPVR